MKKWLYILLGLFLLVVIVIGCTESAQVTTTTTTASTTVSTSSTATSTTGTTTTSLPNPGYLVYSGSDMSGQAFTFEYPETWTVSVESLTSVWNSGTWIMFKGAGDYQTGRPVLSLWIVVKAGSLGSYTAYDNWAYFDRNIDPYPGVSGPGLLSETATSETIAGSPAQGWRIVYSTRLPAGQIYTSSNVENFELMYGPLVNAEREWLVFEKGNYCYDLNFAAVGGDATASREAAFVHAKNTFKFH